MKNLLLIFILGFALLWVGCEKEEIHLPVEAASAEQASDQDKASSRSQEMPCECTSVSPVTITQNTMNQGITCLDDFVEGVSGTFEATPAIIDEGNSWIETKVYVNSLSNEVECFAVTSQGGCDDVRISGFFVPYSYLNEYCLVKIITEFTFTQNAPLEFDGDLCSIERVNSYFVNGVYSGTEMETIPDECSTHGGRN